MTDEARTNHDGIDLHTADLLACAYNAAVNYGSGRAHKTMIDLLDAINRYERRKGRGKLEALVEAGVIESFMPCPPECVVKPGGLFHAKGCENEMNHPVYHGRQAKAREMLTRGTPHGVHDGYWDASVTLVGR